MDKFINSKISNEVIKDEILKPTSYQCFNGAWYYKALSSKDKWLGIDAVITLPLFDPDEDRYSFIDDNLTNKKIKRYNDTPSVYVGVCSDFENDVGFGWFRGKVEGKVLEEKITFRPFWRYIFEENSQEKNIYAGSKLDEDEYYYFPGDKVRVTVASPRANYLQFRIELIEATSIEKYKTIRSKLKSQPKTFVSLEFIAPGVGIKPTEVKRVNAIDQYGNEGRPTQMTNAIVHECIWEDVYLYREINGEIVRVKFDDSRYIRMLCPRETAFKINYENGKETVIINPGAK